MKKRISLFTLICAVIATLIAISGLFSLIKLKGTTLDLLFTFLTLTVAGFLTINSCTMLEKKNKLAIISFGLIFISALLVVIFIWSNVTKSNIFTSLTSTLCILSIYFNLIVSNILKTQNRYLTIQASSYICFTIVSFFLVAISWGSNILSKSLKLFVLFVILSVLSQVVLMVLSKKQSDDIAANKNYVKISKEEYEILLKAKEELARLKGEKND